MPSRLNARRVLTLAGLCLLMTYQNCAQAPDSENDNSSFSSGLPWAYQEKVDTIGYMSCSEIKDAVDRRAYFSYRVSAFNSTTGGMTMTPAFREATQYLSVTDRANAVANSDVNAAKRLTLSVRSRANLQSIWSQGSMRLGDEIDNMIPNVSAGNVAGPMTATRDGAYVNYFPGSESQRLMEGSLRFYEFENVSKDTRSNLEGAGTPAYLTVGYGNVGDDLDVALAGSSSGSLNRAYGTGYALAFSLPRSYQSGERRVLAANGGVQEIDLQTGQPRGANWNCSQEFQFMVIRPEDKANGSVLCNATVDRFTNATEQAALNAIRRVLRVEDWYVDLQYRCVMPKRTGDYCYGALNGATIQYGSANCVNSGTTRCPHFVSVCIRQ